MAITRAQQAKTDVKKTVECLVQQGFGGKRHGYLKVVKFLASDDKWQKKLPC